MKETIGLIARRGALALALLLTTLSINAYSAHTLSFEENLGQVSPDIRFLARTEGYDLFLQQHGFTVRLHGLHQKSAVNVQLQFEGIGEGGEIVPQNPQPGIVNYYIGNDPSRWLRNIATYDRVRYQDPTGAASIVLYGNEAQLEYDLELGPGVDPSSIRLSVDGADNIHLNTEGDLVLVTAAGDLVMRKPLSYQDRNGRRRIVKSAYVLTGAGKIGFRLAAHDPKKPVTIDPVFTFSTYLGGTADESGNGIDIDGSGNVYVTGQSASVNFPAVSAFQFLNAGKTDAFVTKFNAAGQLVYSTYLGGADDDAGMDIKVDILGNAYVVGTTSSASLPAQNLLMSTYSAGTDGFFSKLDSKGAVTFSRYIGGVGDDTAVSLALDSGLNVYVGGSTKSSNLGGGGSTTNYSDAFVVKLAQSGLISYQATFGGIADDAVSSLTIDSSGSVYATGVTRSPDFPTLTGFQGLFGGASDCFLVRLNAAGVVSYSSFLGGSGDDRCNGIVLDSTGLYLTGTTTSSNFPTSRPAQPTNHGGSDAFVAKLNSAASALIYSTYIGGSGDDLANRIAVDANGAAFVVGNTTSTNFPGVNAYQATNAGSVDAFTLKLNASGSLVAASYLGGSQDDSGNSLKVDSGGNVYITGSTRSTDFPLSAAVQSALAGGFDAFTVVIPENQFRPKNDDLVNAITLTGTTGSATGSNVGATLETKENVPTRAGTTSVWWRWTAPFTGNAVVDTIGSDFDTILGIFRGTEIGNLTAVASDDDSGGNGTSLANFPVTENTTYFISVNGFSSTSGHITLHWSLSPPAISGSVTVSGFPTTAAAGQQQPASIVLGTRYPLALSGQLVMTFAPDVTVPGAADDPSIQFATGGRTVNFTIPANTNQSVFADGSGAVAFQTGTVAGTITFRVALQVLGQDITPSPSPVSSVSVSRQAPTISNVSINNSSNTSFELVITGYATSRQVNQAVFSFAAAPGTTLRTSSVTVDLSGIFSQWFQSATSQQFGSQFKLTIPFTLQTGSRVNLSSVGVTLVNSVGSSSPVTRNF